MPVGRVLAPHYSILMATICTVTTGLSIGLWGFYPCLALRVLTCLKDDESDAGTWFPY